VSTSEINTVLIKFFNKTANAKELDELDQWIQDPANELIFKDYVKTHYAVMVTMNDPDPKQIKKQLLYTIRKEKRLERQNKLRSVLKYAAIVIALIGMGYYFQNEFFGRTSNQIVESKADFITLELENGNIQMISEDGTSKVVDAQGNVVGSQDGDKLVYTDDSSTEKLVFNKLTVPYGKRFDIVLSDGTSIFLNSGSSIKYPVKFLKDRDRQVFLKGEAFFDVAKDSLHRFVVDAQELNVEVLGTKFNVSTYAEDERIEVVLVEGSVDIDSPSDVEDKRNSLVLKPGFNGVYYKKGKTISTAKVNTSLYTSWMTGIVIFRNTPFSEITKKLERLYNVSIKIDNKQLATENFNASIEIDNETIEEVLTYFSKVYEIEFDIERDKILIH